MPLPHISTGQLVTAAWLNDVVDRINAFLADVTGGIWTGTVQNVAQSFRGLRMRTHPNAAAAPSQVAVLRLDEVVTSSGRRYLPPTTIFPLVADITGVGAGGLDTGTEVTSAWYEIWLIGKSATGATSDLRLMLHRAKQYTLDQSQTAFTTNSPLRFGATTNVKLAQSFLPSASGKVEFVDIEVFRAGTPTGTMWLTLEAVAGGNPSGSALATSDKLDVAVVSTGHQWIRFPFRAPTTVTSGTTYNVVLQGDYAISGTNYVSWDYQATNAYANGQFFTYNGTSWTASAAADQTFKVYVTTNEAAVTMPSGYDESVRLGFVYNNSSGSFVGFNSIDRFVRRLSPPTSGSIAATLPTLTDISSAVPPVPCAVHVSVTNATSTNNFAAPVPDGYDVTQAASAFVGGASIVSTPGVGGGWLSMAPVFTEYQGLYLQVGAGTSGFYLTQYNW